MISGTSCDAIDAALVDFGSGIELLAYRQQPLPATLRESLLSGPKLNAGRIAELDRLLGMEFAMTARALLAQTVTRRVAAIGCHGQTIFHRPKPPIGSLQIGDPSTIAYLTGIRTVADFRAMDIAAGGQGAPLAPAFHAEIFKVAPAAIVNIGGIANVTLLAANGAVLGYDCGPGNTLLDAWTRRHLRRPFDRDGGWAASGCVIDSLLSALLADPYFALPAPKSTGPEYFNLEWLDRVMETTSGSARPEDVQSTLVELTVRTIAATITGGSDIKAMYICGGGVNNPVLMEALRRTMPVLPVSSTAKLGLPPDCVEAAMFAWLAKQRIEGKPANLPAVTGAERRVLLGAIYDPA
jgi:anhydro-N-acetylmuramic acid kinase